MVWLALAGYAAGGLVTGYLVARAMVWDWYEDFGEADTANTVISAMAGFGVALVWPIAAVVSLVVKLLNREVEVNHPRARENRIRQHKREVRDLERELRLGEETRWPNDDDHYGLGRR